MPNDFAQIDDQLRRTGRIMKLMAHPSRLGLRFLHRILSLRGPERRRWIDCGGGLRQALPSIVPTK